LTVANRLLLQIPDQDRAAILRQAELIAPNVGDVLQEIGEVPAFGYFPESGLGSIVAVMEDGSMTEAASVGLDGFLGASLVTGTGRSSTRIVWQVPGEAHRVPAAAFRDVAGRPAVRTALLGYLQEMMDQMSQVAGCNRRHSLSARAARRLLMTDDRVIGNVFQLTHEFLATMLGADRPKVTLAARDLRERGLITYRRGVVTVLDRPGLEAAACECYEVLARAFPGRSAGGVGSAWKAARR
jgi:CRP-like cAMP-binding protein